MKKSLYFLILPTVYLLSKKECINEIDTVISCLIFVFSNFLICTCISYGQCLLKHSGNMRNFWNLIFLLIFLDQGIKIFVSGLEVPINLIGKYLRIQERRNLNQFAALNYLDMYLSQEVVVLIKIVLLIVLSMVFVKCYKQHLEYTYIGLLLITAAGTSLLDSIFWGYTLDYFYFYNLICYDLKDFYVDTALGLIIAKQVSSF